MAYKNGENQHDQDYFVFSLYFGKRFGWHLSRRQGLTEKREACDHFSGETPNPEVTGHTREVQQQIHALWRGTDRRLAALKSKYVHNAKVQDRLRRFEPQIEPKARPSHLP